MLTTRRQQIDTWISSDTNKSTILSRSAERVKFPIDVQFFAACSNSEMTEVKELLLKGVDINVVNIDGLTVLHQACIDNDYELAQFLIENKANVNIQDNEGWTPLHACASCSYTELAKLLLDNGASAGIASFDAELPIDVAQGTDIISLLKTSMEAQTVDASSARKAEEVLMAEEANDWLKCGKYPLIIDPRTGASALHVAAAKDYGDVLELLLKLPDLDIEMVDNDGWTALHAAAHWGKERPLRLLASAGASFDKITLTNQTIFDVADRSVTMLLRQLRESQRLKNQNEPKRVPSPIKKCELEKDQAETKIANDIQQLNKVHTSEVAETNSNVEPPKKIPSPIPFVDDDNEEAETKSLISSDEKGDEIVYKWSRPIPTKMANSALNGSFDEVEVLDAARLPPPAVRKMSVESESKDDNNTQINRVLTTEPMLRTSPPKEADSSSESSSKSKIDRVKRSDFKGAPIQRVSAVLAPMKSEETEAQRSSKARFVRSIRRSTQGIADDVLEEAKRRSATAIVSSTTDNPSTIALPVASQIVENTANVNTCAPITSISLSKEDNRTVTNSVPDNDSQNSKQATVDLPTLVNKNPESIANFTQSYSNSCNIEEKKDLTSSTISSDPLSGITDSNLSSSLTSPIRSRRLARERVPTGNINKADVTAAILQTEITPKSREDLLFFKRPTSRYITSNTSANSNNSDRPAILSQSPPLSTLQRSNSACGDAVKSSDRCLRRETIDYKRLYEEERCEKERLNKTLNKMHQELKLLRNDLAQIQSSKQFPNSSDSNEALPQSISYYEHQSKEIERLRTENAKIGDENKSLIRVISKLSNRANSFN